MNDGGRSIVFDDSVRALCRNDYVEELKMVEHTIVLGPVLRFDEQDYFVSSNLRLISREVGKCPSARVKGNAGGPLNHLILRWTTVVASNILIIRVL